MYNKEFTIAEGISTQKEHLNKWKMLLKPEIFSLLEEWSATKNTTAKTGNDIVRGVDLDNFIHNIHYNKKNQLIEKKNELKELIADIIERYPELEGKILEIASISYDNVNIDTDIQDCITIIGSVEDLLKQHTIQKGLQR
ncbi:hypothetical protein [Chryseobacterium sp. 18068]|uniref:hypothetical protein n=1 Tax=Chryseobacterium sp. 18068 TaxID=2681414 RepID=UPI0013584AC6|nr:hypothetical protein [Chryseobacterium sp. 18068]